MSEGTTTTKQHEPTMADRTNKDAAKEWSRQRTAEMSEEPAMTPEQRASLAKAAGQPAVTGPAPVTQGHNRVAEHTAEEKAALGKAAMVIAARAAHEANRSYCQHLGDDSQAPWADAADWQKQSAVAGVQNIIKNPGTTPAQSHSLWMAQKGADGWVYGEEKSEAAKTHPCMVPYAELPVSQQFKDSLFGAVVRGVLGVK